MEAPKGKSTPLEANWEQSPLSPGAPRLSDEIRDNPGLRADNAFPIPENRLPPPDSPGWNSSKTPRAASFQERAVFLGRASLGARCIPRDGRGGNPAGISPISSLLPRGIVSFQVLTSSGSSARRLPGQGKSQGTSQGFPILSRSPPAALPPGKSSSACGLKNPHSSHPKSFGIPGPG